MVVNSQLSGTKEKISSLLSDAVTSEIKSEGPSLLAQSYDIFVRETPGGKIVMNKLSMGTLLPIFAIGFLAGWLISGRFRK